MSTRDISATFQEMYDAEVPRTVMANVTEAVWETVQSWQNRPLDEAYPIVYLDGLVVKVQTKTVVCPPLSPLSRCHVPHCPHCPDAKTAPYDQGIGV